jgi:Zn-finger nucleic acid-binding protein
VDDHRLDALGVGVARVGLEERLAGLDAGLDAALLGKLLSMQAEPELALRHGAVVAPRLARAGAAYRQIPTPMSRSRMRCGSCADRAGLHSAATDLCCPFMILACPACDSRYDVTGHPAGQQLRCRCGAMMTLPWARQPPASRVSALWRRRGGDRQPRYCRAELLVKACPLPSRVFHGHKHCPECGAELELAATADPGAVRPCPRCAAPLQARRVGDLVIDECSACLGVFLDHVAIKRVVVDRAQARADALLGALPRAAPARSCGRAEDVPAVPGVPRRDEPPAVATGTGIIIDVCRTHGTLFDAASPQVIEFVMNGGLSAPSVRT